MHAVARFLRAIPREGMNTGRLVACARRAERARLSS